MSEIIEQSKYKKSPEIIPAKLAGAGEIKTQNDLEQLAEKRIVDASLLAKNLELSGKNRFKEIIKLYGNILGSKSIDISVISAKVDLENEIIRDLFKKLKSKIKIAVTIGMATMAFSGAGNFEKIKEAGADNETKVMSTESIELESMTEEERSAIENYKQLVEEAQESSKKLIKIIKEDSDPKLKAEKIKNDLKKHVGSEAYLNKLKIEFGGDIEWAKNVQRDRLGFLDSVKTNFSDKQSMQGKVALLIEQIPDDVDVPIPEWLLKIVDADSVGGFYRPLQHKVFLQNQYTDDRTTQHEYLHASTRSNMGISEKAEKILRNSYEPIGEKTMDDYLSKTTERLVRKQALDAEMEKLGIKKYGENFTDEHYNKLEEYNKTGKLSADLRDFMKTTKPEYFKQIFNEIATNKNINSDSTKHV